jgi:ubiquinone/menaquinone biosynthesis C-methylase UbiE
MTTTNTQTTSPDFELIKQRQQATWSSGDFSIIGSSLQIVGELLAESVGIEAGWHVLDVAAGNGNAALAAARRNAHVIATDYVPALLEDAAARARADGLPLATEVADAEHLPYGDRTFDAVLSTFGVMFTPNPERAAAELLRVTRPGGRIGLASWTPTSFVAEMFKTVGRYVPPAPVPSVFQWGDKTAVNDLLGDEIQAVAAQTRTYVFRYESAEHFVDVFRTYYGPTNRAFAALEADQQDALEHDLVEFARSWNRSTAGALAVPADYLELVAIRR